MSAPRSECEPVLPLLAAMRDGELDPATAAQVSAHVAVCDDCGARLEDQQRVAGLVATHARTPRLDPRQLAAFEAGLERGLRATRPEVARPRFALLRRISFGPALTAAAGLLFVGFLAQSLSGVAPSSALAYTRHRLPDLPHHDPVPRGIAAVGPRPALDSDDGWLASERLTATERAALERDGLVQAPAFDRRATDFLAAVPVPPPLPSPVTKADDHAEWNGHPLVTFDAALVLWNATVARAAVEVERARIEPLLRESLDALGKQLEAIHDEVSDAPGRRACERAQGVVGVAADLDGLVPRVSGALKADVLADAAAVWIARGRARSRTRGVLGARGVGAEVGGNSSGVELDLDSFRPRGPLAVSPEHFRTITWLSQSAFALEGADADPRAAAILGLAFARAHTTDGVRLLALWDGLDSTVELLHGPQQDLGVFELLAALTRAFGPTASVDALKSDAAVARFVHEAHTGAEARAWTLGTDRAAPAAFTILGGTRTIEGLVLESVSAPRLPGRTRPGSLDLLAALGSRPARTLASLEGVAGYDRALDALAPRLAGVRDVTRAPSFAGSGVERARLFALAGLLEQEDGTPDEAHESRRLLAALAALNGTAPASLDAPEPVVDSHAPLPFVEPAPALYERLAHGARRIAQGLEPGTKPDSAVGRSLAQLKRVAALLSGLARASVETLEDRALSERSQVALAAFYPTLATLAPGKAVSVEDLHVVVLPSGEREILERAAGPFDRVLEVVRIPGTDPRSMKASAPFALVVGPALSAREVVVRDARLAPESLEQAPRLPDPSWATHVVK